MNEGQPFPPYDAPGEDGLPLKNVHVPGVPIVDNSRRMAKDVIKLSKVKVPQRRTPRVSKPKFKSDVKWY